MIEESELIIFIELAHQRDELVRGTFDGLKYHHCLMEKMVIFY